MTASTLDPTATASGPLDAPSAADVLLLQAVHDYPCVSVLCTSEPAPRMAPAVVTRARAMIDDVGRRLRAEPGGDEHGLADRLREALDAAATSPNRGAIALFASRDHTSAWSLPLSVVDRAVVDPTFATRDLVRALHRTPRHVVLVLTDRRARVFDGVGDTLVPAIGGAFPMDRAERTEGAGGRADRHRGRRASGDPEAFAREVDQALGAHLRLHPAPLVLVGATEVLARFTRTSRHLARLAGTVRGSHARTPLPQLAGLIRPVLDEYLRSRQEEALRLLDERVGARRVASGIDAVWLAARAERPEMLAVEQGLFHPARLSDDGDFLQPADDVEHPDVIDDAVDEVIEVVLQRGGWVALVEDGSLAAHDGVALSLRTR